MFGTSISRLIIVLQSILLAGFVSVMAIVAVLSWRDATDASNILDATTTDKLLFDAMIGVRQQIASTQTAIVSRDDLASALGDTRSIADTSFQSALSAMAALDIPGKDAQVSTLEAAWQEMKQREAQIDALASTPKADRDLKAAAPWSDAVRGVVNAISDASLLVGNDVRLLDPFVAEMIQIRRSAWQVRDHYGSQCSLLRPFISQNQPLTVEALSKWQNGIGSYQVAWGAIDLLLARPGAPAQLVAAVASAQKATGDAQGSMNTLVGKLDNSGQPAIAPVEYTAMCNGPFDKIVDIGHMAMDEAVTHGKNALATAQVVLGFSALTLLLVLALSFFAITSVLRRFSRPIGILMTAVGKLSMRHFAEPVPALPYPDELGRLSIALEELRHNALEAERLQAEQQAQQQHQIERGEKLATAVSSFERGISRVVNAVRSASDHMQTNAQNLSVLAEDANSRSVTVAHASEEASGNVQTVAAASEELSASISEVNQQINNSSRMATEAVGEVDRTNESFEDLKAAAEKIGAVVELIQNIASQTNLLALNATIESARAGEAGKGFAVVANEVKTLATQTHKATEDISAQIAGMQSAVGGCITAISTIGHKIRTIDEAISAISAATEEQSSATQEIARNVQHAAAGTAEVSDNISSVTEMAGKTGLLSADVLEASSQLSAQADALGQEVEQFLAEVRAI
ncbi:MAG: HAMP domain-containing methyl-accepting chemotaxis protein [Pseudomonadota bacterium]